MEGLVFEDVLYQRGLDAEKDGDIELALQLYRKAAELGKKESFHRIGSIFQNEIPSGEKAIMAYMKSIMTQHNTDESYYNIGRIYYCGMEGLEVDFEKAHQFFKRGSNSKCLFMCGKMLLEGKGVVRDPKKSYKFFKKAAGLGCHKSMEMISKLYSGGIGVGKSVKKARKWETKAVKALQVQDGEKIKDEPQNENDNEGVAKKVKAKKNYLLDREKKMKNLRAGEIFWVKVPGQKWWPAKIVDHSKLRGEMFTPIMEGKLRHIVGGQQNAKERFLFQFLNDDTYTWVSASEHKRYREFDHKDQTLSDEHLESIFQNPALVEAIKEAKKLISFRSDRPISEKKYDWNWSSSKRRGGDGEASLPYRIVNVGFIGSSPKFHTEQFIYPVKYKALFLFQHQRFELEVQEDFSREDPVFVLQLFSSKNAVIARYRSTSINKCWQSVTDLLAPSDLRVCFGFGSAKLAKLPNATKWCAGNEEVQKVIGEERELERQRELERLEKERLESEKRAQLEKEQIEREKERARLERLRIRQERMKAELEKVKLEKELQEMEKKKEEERRRRELEKREKRRERQNRSKEKKRRKKLSEKEKKKIFKMTEEEKKKWKSMSDQEKIKWKEQRVKDYERKKSAYNSMTEEEKIKYKEDREKKKKEREKLKRKRSLSNVDSEEYPAKRLKTE